LIDIFGTEKLKSMSTKKGGYPYIVSNYNRNVFYTGVTSDIERRSFEHYKGEGGAFTEKYKCKYLVYYEHFESILDAIKREKQIKNRPRQWKIELIKSVNPLMKDLAAEWRKEDLS
jgi:putative endonuclease